MLTGQNHLKPSKHIYNICLDDLLLPTTDLMLLVNTPFLIILRIFWPHVHILCLFHLIWPLGHFWAVLDIFWPYDHWSDQPLAWRPPASSNWSDVVSSWQGQDFGVCCPRRPSNVFSIEVKYIWSWIGIQLCSIDGPPCLVTYKAVYVQSIELNWMLGFQKVSLKELIHLNLLQSSKKFKL